MSIRFGLMFWEKIFISTHCPWTFKVVHIFRRFFSPLPTGGKWAVWPKSSETFSFQYPLDSSGCFERKNFKFSILHYPTDTRCRFGLKKLKIFSFHFSPVHEEPLWTKESEIFSSPNTPLTKTAVWSKESETLFFPVPTGQKSPFGQKVLKFFLFPIPTGQKRPFWTKENEKSPRKFSEGSRKIHISVL